jgi:hypothetical protein
MREAPSGTNGIQGGIQVVNFRASGIEIYNNSFDGGGVAMDFRGPAIFIADGCFVDSLRSNLFYGFRPAALSFAAFAALLALLRSRSARRRVWHRIATGPTRSIGLENRAKQSAVS